MESIVSALEKKSIIKKLLKHIDEIWSIDLDDMIDYKTSHKKGFRYMFVIIDRLFVSLSGVYL